MDTALVTLRSTLRSATMDGGVHCYSRERSDGSTFQANQRLEPLQTTA
jgi:hypothetical protein